MRYSKSFIIMTFLMFVSSISVLYGVGTSYNTKISNYAEVSGANFTTTGDYTNVYVQRIAGGHWTGKDDKTTGVNAGDYVTNITYLTNLGNDIFTFQFSINANNSGGGATATPWAWMVYTNGVAAYASWQTGTGATFNLSPLPSGSVVTLSFVVQVSNSETGGWEEWQFRISDTGTHTNTDNYQGDNGTWYGGPNGQGWGDTIADSLACYMPDTAGNGATVWRVQVSGPVITLQKSISWISNLTDADGPDNVAVPGATILYVIKLSNGVGAGDATGPIIVKDTIQTQYVDFVAGSMSVTGWDAANWNSGVHLPDISWTNSANNMPGGNATRFSFKVRIK